MAGRTWRTGLDPGAALDFRSRMCPRRRAERQCDGRQDGRPRHHRLRQPGTEELLLAADSFRRRLLVPRLFRNGLRVRSRLAKTASLADGDNYIVNGTKIWTTHAHHANRMFALVRTNDTPRQQDGISFILIDMNSPGITIRPILTIGGDHEVNQVFFDDVRVPIANRVGEEGKGWTYGKYLLEFERGAGIGSAK